jgi:hypothetical protein
MTVMARIIALEKASPKNKTRYISNADCAASTDFVGCTQSTCQCGCWYTEEEYDKYMTKNGHAVTEWEC